MLTSYFPAVLCFNIIKTCIQSIHASAGYLSLLFTPCPVFSRFEFLLQAQSDVSIGARKVPNRDLLLVWARIGEMTSGYLPKTYPLSLASIRQG